MGWRIALSIVMFFGLIVFVIIWLFFFAGDFNVYQNVAVVISALLVFIGIMGASWATMWMKWGKMW
ncbi:MAG: hypothetical protein ACE5LS_00805 [Thermoplasmata archaeon]